MKNILRVMGMTVGGYAGWALGAPFSFFTAFVLSMVGTGVGIYAAQRVAKTIML